MATVEEFVQSCCMCAAVAFCCDNSPLGPQRRIAAAQAQTDSKPAPSSLLWPRPRGGSVPITLASSPGQHTHTHTNAAHMEVLNLIICEEMSSPP